MISKQQTTMINDDSLQIQLCNNFFLLLNKIKKMKNKFLHFSYLNIYNKNQQ